MKFLIHWLLVVFTVLNPMLANAALTDYDRQEISFENLLGKYNGGFESGKANWTASGGTFTAVTSGTNLLNGKGSFTWDASASGQTLTSQAVTIPKGYYGQNCEAEIVAQVPSGDASHYVESFDGSNVVGRSTIVSSTTPRKNTVTFPCPSSGTIALRVYANADEPLIAGDLGYLGLSRNVGVTQYITPLTTYSPSFNSTTGHSASNGWYYRKGDRAVIGGSVLWNGTGAATTFTVTTPSVCTIDTAKLNDTASISSIRNRIGIWSWYDDSGGLSINPQWARSNTTSSLLLMDGSNTVISNIFANNDRIAWEVDVPCVGWEASPFVAIQNQGWYIDATIAGGNPSLGTSAVSSYTELTSASLTLAPRTGSAAAGIMCSSTNAATAPTTSTSTCAAGSESLGVNFNIPTTGAYKVCALFSHFAQVDQSEAINAAFQIVETPTNAQTITTEGGTRTISGTTALTIATGTTAAVTTPNNNCSIFNWSSVGTKGVRLMYEQAVTGTPNNSLILADEDGSTGQRNFRVTVERLNAGVNAFLVNGVVARDAVGGQVTTVNTIVSKTTTYTATADEETISASTSGGAWTLSLPAAASVKGKKYHIVQTADTANALTIDPNSTETICGQTTVILKGPRDTIDIQSDGTNWIGLGESCWRVRTAKIDCDSSSSNLIDRQYTISSIGNISGGTCSVTLNTGVFSGTPELVVSWYGSGAASGSDFYGVCTSSTSCVLGGPGAATSAQLNVIWRGPR